MYEAQLLKDLLNGLADAWNVPRPLMHRTVRQALTPSQFGATYRYWQRHVTKSEMNDLNLPSSTVLIAVEGSRRWWCAIHPSTYKDKEGAEHAAACAYGREYLEKLTMTRIPWSDLVPDPDRVDGRPRPASRLYRRLRRRGYATLFEQEP